MNENQNTPDLRLCDVNDQPLLLVSFSGGRTSAFMTKWIIDNWTEKYKIMVVYANTGKEREETLDFVEKCDKYFGFNCIWVEAITQVKIKTPKKTHVYDIRVWNKMKFRLKAGVIINDEGNADLKYLADFKILPLGVKAKVVDFKTASRDGEPFEAMISKHGMPSIKSPHCTRELKRYTINAYARSIGWKKYFTAIGYRVDEFDRAAPDWKKQRHIYPLISNVPTRKNDINKFWRDQPFDLELKTYEGNCDLCFKKSFRKLMTIVNETPETAIWWAEMERKYSDFIPPTKAHNPLMKPPIHCFRQNKSIYDIVEMAKQPFEPALDESQYRPEYKQTSLYDLYELDVTEGCGDSESCEVF